jgi:23S rRNA (cytidine1920-2'-O)/16S rRNA (cytidine1409-2'-O)-methyltransferase
MVKPQFEVGKDRVGTGGVVRDPALRATAVLDVVSVARGLGLVLVAATASPLPGPAGNVEYFVLLRPTLHGLDGDRAGTSADEEARGRAEVERAVAEGPGGVSGEPEVTS